MAEIAGLKLIVPSSVAGSGVSVSASGKVTFSSSTDVNINGCFTSSYDNYLIVIRHTAASPGQELQLRLRASGSDASGSNYTYQSLVAASTSVSGSRTSSATFARVGYVAENDGDHIYLYGPNLAQPTAMRNVNVFGNNGGEIRDFASTHSLSTAYDGCTIFLANSIAMTGACTIYGLSQ